MSETLIVNFHKKSTFWDISSLEKSYFTFKSYFKVVFNPLPPLRKREAKQEARLHTS